MPRPVILSAAKNPCPWLVQLLQHGSFGSLRMTRCSHARIRRFRSTSNSTVSTGVSEFIRA